MSDNNSGEHGRGHKADLHNQDESEHHLMAEDLPLMFSNEREKGLIMLGGEEGLKAIMEEYDVNRNGYLEWEEYVRFYDSTVPRPTNLEICVMRRKQDSEEEDPCLGLLVVSLNDIEQGHLIVEPLQEEDDSHVLGNGDKIATLSFRVQVFNLSSETGVSPSDDPATDSLRLLLQSSRVLRELQYCHTMGADKYPISLVFRQFDPEMACHPERHFRVFVYDSSVTAISQRNKLLYFHYLNTGLNKCHFKERIISFFWTTIFARMHDLSYTKYIFDVFVHTDDASQQNPHSHLSVQSERITLLSFSPFDEVTDACMYDWSSGKDVGILTMGRLFAHSNDRNLQPKITLSNGQVVSNVDIRVRTEPVQDALTSLPALWRKKLGKVMDKLEAQYEGRFNEDVVAVQNQEKVALFSCNPYSLLPKFMDPSRAMKSLKHQYRDAAALSREAAARSLSLAGFLVLISVYGFRYTHTHSHTHTCSSTYTHAQTHTYILTCRHGSCTHTHMFTHLHALANTYIYTYVQAWTLELQRDQARLRL
jgi:hypothetical protein